MSIRVWFNVDGTTNNTSGVKIALDRLLVVYQKALSSYFGFHDAENVAKFIENVELGNCGNKDELFVDWLKQKGIPLIRFILTAEFQDDENLINQLEYERYILEKEIGCGGSEDLRSAMIDVLDELPNRIELLKYQEKYKFETFYQNTEENEYLPPKVEGVHDVGSYDYFGGVELNGFYRI